MKIQERTKKELFESLLLWLSQTQKELIKTEIEIEELEKEGQKGEVDLSLCLEYVALKIHLDTYERKIASIKNRIKVVANIK